MSLPVYITDEFRAIVSLVNAAVLSTIQANEIEVLTRTNIQGISFHNGTVDELIATLAQKDRSRSNADWKYPLIYLLQPFTESRGKKPGVYAETSSLKMYIIHQTSKDDKITDRETKVLKPVLNPIYYALMKEIAYCTRIMESDEDLIPHDYTFLPYKGSEANPSKNTLNDTVDAIELANLKLNFYLKTC